MKDFESLGQVSILSVEDDDFNQELAMAVFDDIPNVTVLRASNGKEAIDIIETKSVDLVLLDIRMPDMDGLETLKYIKENNKYRHIPVIMVTSQPQEKKTAYYLGADDFISKPYAPEELKLRVFNYLRLKNYDQILSDIQKSTNNTSSVSEVYIEKLKEAIRMAEDSEELLEKLGALTHANDFHINQASKRLGEYAKLLANLSGLSNTEANNLQYSMYIYDIGLLKVSDKNKDSKDFRKHPTYGYEILNTLEDTTLNKMAKEVTLHHHENWDGSGYPDKLKGDDIPVYVRIARLVDTFDELTSKRFYSSDVVSSDEALKIMKRDRGSIFDPHIFDIFEENFNKFKDIKKKYD